jgi:hypothetical protein
VQNYYYFFLLFVQKIAGRRLSSPSDCTAIYSLGSPKHRRPHAI